MHFDKKMSGISPKNHKQGINFPLLSQTYVTGSGLQGLGSTSLPKLKSSTPPPSPRLTSPSLFSFLTVVHSPLGMLQHSKSPAS